MIISITPNPALDIAYFPETFQLGEANRVERFVEVPGGKGVNVAKVLNELGADVCCTGFLGGSAGLALEAGLQSRQLAASFTPIAGETRRAYAITDQSTRKTTELREAGPHISEKEQDDFFENLKKLLPEAELFTCSGSLPQGLDVSFYDRLRAAVGDKPLLLDTSGAGLRHVVLESEKKPYAIKPNQDEMRDLFGEKADSESPVELLQHEELAGIPVIVMSLGKDGCAAKIEDQIFLANVPVIEVVNPVGSGDSTLAGLAYAISQDSSPEDMLRIAMTCGVLNTMEAAIGHIDKNRWNEIYEQITVKEVL